MKRLRKYLVPDGLDAEVGEIFEGIWLMAEDGGGIVCAVPSPDPSRLADFYRYRYRTALKKARRREEYEASPNYRARAWSQAQWTGETAGEAPSSWLDVGAGYGMLLSAVRERWPTSRCTAIEADEDCVGSLRRVGFEVLPEPSFWTSEVHEARSTESFDVISLSHVLEHLVDPRNALLRLRSRLNPRGCLMVEVPNDGVDSLLWKGRRSDIPHLWFFSLEGLVRMVEEAGYEVVRGAAVGTPGPTTTVTVVDRVRWAISRRLRPTDWWRFDRRWYGEDPSRADLRVIARPRHPVTPSTTSARQAR